MSSSPKKCLLTPNISERFGLTSLARLMCVYSLQTFQLFLSDLTGDSTHAVFISQCTLTVKLWFSPFVIFGPDLVSPKTTARRRCQDGCPQARLAWKDFDAVPISGPILFPFGLSIISSPLICNSGKLTAMFYLFFFFHLSLDWDPFDTDSRSLMHSIKRPWEKWHYET